MSYSVNLIVSIMSKIKIRLYNILYLRFIIIIIIIIIIFYSIFRWAVCVLVLPSTAPEY